MSNLIASGSNYLLQWELMEITTQIFAIMQILIENHWKVRKCKLLTFLATFHYLDQISNPRPLDRWKFKIVLNGSPKVPPGKIHYLRGTHYHCSYLHEVFGNHHSTIYANCTKKWRTPSWRALASSSVWRPYLLPFRHLTTLKRLGKKLYQKCDYRKIFT